MRIREVLAGASSAVGGVVLLGLCHALTATAAMNDWTAIGPVGGGVYRVVFSQTLKVVFAIAAGGFYRSVDGGLTWQLVSSSFFNFPSDVVLDPADPSRLYVTSPNTPALLVSTDGGATLAPSATFPATVVQASHMAVSHDGQTLYVDSTAQFYASLDRGQTWTPRTPMTTYSGALVVRLAVDPTDSKTLYSATVTSATADAILVTHDGGSTWQVLRTVDPNTSYVQDLAVNPANPRQLWTAQNDGVWVSSDGGATWSQSLTTPASTLTIDPANPAVVYAGTGYGQAFRTADSGGHWTEVTGNLGAGQLLCLAVNPAQDSQLLAGGLNGLAGSATAGTQWSVQQSGILATTIGALAADPGSDRIYIAVPGGGVYYEPAGSGTTQPVNNASILALAAPSKTFYISAILAQTGRLLVSQAPWLYSSNDGGSSWSTDIVTGIASNQLFSMASSPATPQIVLGAPWRGLYRSADGGVSWNPVAAGITSADVVSRVVTAPSDASVAYASVYSPPTSGSGAPTLLGVFRSADAGISWIASTRGTPGSSPDGVLGVDPRDANVVYGTSNASLLKSMDGGGTWTTLPWDPGHTEGGLLSFAIDSVHPQILYAAGTVRIARSVDGGASWETLHAGSVLPVWSPFALLVDPRRPERLLVGTSKAGVQVISAAPDLALSVAAPASPVAVNTPATYAYTVSNLGPFDATGVEVSIQLPANAQAVTATPSAGTCSVAGTAATCTLPVLRVGANATLNLNATPAAVGSFLASASVAADQPDPNALNNGVSSTSSVATIADLSVTVTGPNSAQVGGATCTAGGSGLITCALTNLALNGTVMVTVDATVASSGTLASTASVSSTTATDLQSANNTTVATTSGTAHGGGGALSWLTLLALAAIAFARGRRTTIFL